MSLPEQIAKHIRGVYFGGNWTVSCLKENVTDITWQQATRQVYTFNTIATLVYHIHYFVRTVLKVLQGGPLEGNDRYSFDHPPIDSQEDWEQFLKSVWSEAATFADLIEELPESQLWENLADPKYGSYYRNLHGIIEHTHYHLGQIALIKKLLSQVEEH